MASALATRASRPVISCSTCCAPFASPMTGLLTTAAAAPHYTRTSSSFSYSTSTTPEPTPETKAPKPARWSYTPPRAKAPFSLRSLNSRRPDYPVNSNPRVLDEFYIRLLGEGGDKMLSEEVKWLAVTHKSFDQGRRGFNDRLAFLGKRIVDLQTSLALVQVPANFTRTVEQDPYSRQHFVHPALDGLNNLSEGTKVMLTDKSRLADIANKNQVQTVLRWSPRIPNSLQSSGIDLVMAHTMYAIIGAIALEKGGRIANKIAQERILEPLGVKTVA